MEKELKKLLKEDFVIKSNKKKSNQQNFYKVTKAEAINLAISGNNSIIKSYGKCAKLAITGRDSKIANFGENCEITSIGANSYILNNGLYSNLQASNYFCKIINFGDNVNMSSIGTSSIIENKGESCTIFCGGYKSEIKTSGNFNFIHLSNNGIKLKNTGTSSKIFNSGDKNIIKNTGDNTIIHEEGYKNQIECFGKDCQIFIHGKQTIVKANNNTKVTFINNGKNYSFIINDEKDFYTLYKDTLRKCINFGDVISIILSKNKNIYRLKAIENDEEFYVVKTGNTWAYGNTIKEAKQKFIFKIPVHRIETYLERFKSYSLDTLLTLRELIVLITLLEGSCEEGSIDWFSNILNVNYFRYLLKRDKEIKQKYKIKDILKCTIGTRHYEFLIHYFKDKLTQKDYNWLIDNNFDYAISNKEIYNILKTSKYYKSYISLFNLRYPE